MSPPSITTRKNYSPLVVFTITAAVSSYVCIEAKEATFITVSVGDSAVFDCPLVFPTAGKAVPYILVYRKAGDEVFSWHETRLEARPSYQGRIHRVPTDSIYGFGSVNLTNIRDSDSGLYECQVYFPNRSPRTNRKGIWFNVTVEGGTLLNIPPMNHTTMLGESAHFSCITKDKTASVEWFRDGEPLANFSDIMDRSFVNAVGSLTINETKMDDTGFYHCEVTSTEGEVQSGGAYLNVRYVAVVMHSPPEQHLAFGKEGVVNCYFRANPAWTAVKWYKGDYVYDPYNVPDVRLLGNGSLFFRKVDTRHEDVYKCRPSNELGSQGISGPMHVIVQKPPVFKARPNNLYLRKVGDSLEMACDATEGDTVRRPNITWHRKGGFPFSPERTIVEGSNLTLLNIQKEDHGFYQCLASNLAGAVLAETELVVDKPLLRAPHNLSATSNETSVTVRWLAGNRRAKQIISVWYQEAGTFRWRTVEMPSMDVREYSIVGLRPGITYEIMVMSRDGGDEGRVSKTMHATTKELFRSSMGSSHSAVMTGLLDGSQYIAPPVNVSVTEKASGYLVTWEHPEPREHVLDHYKVQWSSDAVNHHFSTAENTQTSYLVTDLDEDNIFYFQVFSVSVNGCQAGSESVAVFIPPANRRRRAITLGVVVGLIFLLFAAGGYWLGRKIYLKRKRQKNEKHAVPHLIQQSMWPKRVEEEPSENSHRESNSVPSALTVKEEYGFNL